MTDVLFYQNYSHAADIAAIAFCIVNYLLLASTYSIGQKNLRLFRVANFTAMLAAFCHIVYHGMTDALTTARVPLIYLMRDATYICLMLTLVLFVVYICNRVEMAKSTKRGVFAVCIIVLAFCAIWDIVAPFTHHGFYIDSDLQVHQNYYTDIFRVCYLFYTFMLIVLLAVYHARFVARVFRSLCAVLVISFLLMMLQAQYLTTSYTVISLMLTMTAMLFLFHYNAYDQDTGSLDAKSFDAYIRNMHDHAFTILCLHMDKLNTVRYVDAVRRISHYVERHYRGACLFRIGDDKMLAVYRDDKNSFLDSDYIMREISFLSREYQSEFRVIIVHSHDSLKEGGDYLALGEFIEENMRENSVYHCTDDDVTAYLKSAYVLSELRDIHVRGNLDDERVKVYCQPVLNTVTDTFTSAEALMRLELPKCGMVYPDQFIPLAEKYGYIHTLSKIILNKTCTQVRHIFQQGYVIERVSVNFSIVELRDAGFCKDVMDIIKHNSIDYDKIAIELTESRSESDFENVKSIMKNLQGLGIKFYLDDFGTGYSNFERIIGLPIDIIKFDRSLTILAGKDAESGFMVGSFSDIFKKSNYQILFEGVEDEKDEDRCRRMNAQYLQGYKYSKPIPMEELVRFLPKAG